MSALDCPAEETIVAFTEGRLSPDALARIESHALTCAFCQDLLGAAMAARTLSVAQASGGILSARRSAPAVQPDASARALAGGDVPLGRGAVMGRYTIVGLVGRGGMGDVFAAYDPELDRKVALKVLRADGPRIVARSRARLLREAQALAKLSHPNIVTVHDVGTFHDRDFIAMSFIDGLTLKEWLAERPRSRAEILSVYGQAARGLAAAHTAGLVHRDFKPSNVMIARDGSVRVMDFGLALGSERSAPVTDDERAATVPRDVDLILTMTGELVGTPAYMAPEQLRLESTDARTDQFSFCVALYEALYGARPFGGAGFSALRAEVLAGQVRVAPPTSSVPTWLRRVLLRGLSVAPDARWGSMNQLVDALARDPARVWSRRGLVVLVTALVALSAVGFGYRGRRVETLCLGGPARFHGVWEIDARQAAHSRREAVHQSLVATGAPGVDETWDRVAALLDHYVGDWLTMYRGACEATTLRHAQSAEALDLRMTCLDARRTAVGALTDVLAHADRDVVSNAVDAVRALPALERCADLNQLRSSVEPPRDEPTRLRVDALRKRLAFVKAMNDAGKHVEADQRARGLVDEARVVGYGPLLAETLSVVSDANNLGGRDAPHGGMRLLEEGVWTALASGRDDLAADMAVVMYCYAAWATNGGEKAKAWSSLATALLDREGPGHDLSRAWFLQDEGVIVVVRDPAAALPIFQASLAIKEKVLAPDDPDLARSVASIADALHDLGRTKEALTWVDRARVIYLRAYGPASIEAAYTLSNRGEYLIDLGKDEEAISDLQQATRLWEAQVGPDSANLGYPLTALGRALISRSREREAVGVLTRALALRVRGEPNQSLIAETRFALARATSVIDRSRADALAALARRAYAAASDTSHVAAVDAWLATHAGHPRGAR
jgi:tetratricopeptide (TPR) repeat protein/predicted Ser/Thr protein kinase